MNSHMESHLTNTNKHEKKYLIADRREIIEPFCIKTNPRNYFPIFTTNIANFQLRKYSYYQTQEK